MNTANDIALTLAQTHAGAISKCPFASLRRLASHIARERKCPIMQRYVWQRAMHCQQTPDDDITRLKFNVNDRERIKTHRDQLIIVREPLHNRTLTVVRQTQVTICMTSRHNSQTSVF